MKEFNLNEITDPSFLKELTCQDRLDLAQQIRTFIIDSLSVTGGHLSSNLGIVDLSIAIHTVFDSPHDKILFDVGHQAYTHKILTGRASQFDTLRQLDGMSGYQKRNESIHDSFEAGHSSTSISTAAGMAVARDLNQADYHVIPVIGDGSIGGGMAFEALNHIGCIGTKVIVILNDNDMSISHNVGGMRNIFSKLRINNSYQKASKSYSRFMKKTILGNFLLDFTKDMKNTLKYHINLNIFEELGFEYIGPIDGHNMKDIILALEKAKEESKPVVVHVHTTKGKGYEIAEKDQTGDWHGCGPFDISTGTLLSKSTKTSWSKVIADAVLEQSIHNGDIVTITPAMISGSKLSKNFEVFPKRSFDVGIAEQHAVTFASGLALQNKRPFVSIYSSFIQRAYDQVNHDICRMDLPVVFGVDRAGIVGEDGDTHHGVFDVGFLRALPNAVMCAPRNAEQAKALIGLGFEQTHPFFIRYPRGEVDTYDVNATVTKIQVGTSECLHVGNSGTIISYGPVVEALKDLVIDRKLDVNVVDIRFFKPLDSNLLDKILSEDLPVVILETDAIACGLASSILEYYNQTGKNAYPLIKVLGIEDHYVEHGSMAQLFEREHIRAQDALDAMEQLLCQK